MSALDPRRENARLAPGADTTDHTIKSVHIIPFRGVRASCACCGTFRRPGEKWSSAGLCPQCHAWIQVGEHMSRAANMLREVGR